jgi:hypothetical protein
MTNEEAVGLKQGDGIEAQINGEWVSARVWGRFIDGTRVILRRIGLMKDGRSYGRKSLPSYKVRFAPQLPPAAANVYADWLEERGQYRAAAMLREAFPFADGKVP